MKKLLATIICAMCIISMCSCSNTFKKTLITDAKMYSSMWSLPERRASERSDLFPSDVDTVDVSGFKCFHEVLFPLGMHWQVELAVKYESDKFSNEVDRIRKLCENSPVFESSDHFESEVYASVWNWYLCFEYALIDRERSTVVYVYLQDLSDNVVINAEYMPIDYSWKYQEADYTIY